MIASQVIQRLERIDIAPAFRSSLHTMVHHDDITSRQNWGFVIPSVSAALGYQDPTLVQPFAFAWGLLNAALRRIDHLQDGDPGDAPVAAATSITAHYNLLLSYYLLATTFLDDLDSHAIPAAHLLQLRRLWSDCLLRVASGQQADLEIEYDEQHGLAELDRYQHLVQAKTGSLFALAFGGAAILLTDDQPTIEILSEIGAVYGMLVQFSDDVVDAASQANPSITLPRAYNGSRAAQSHTLPDVDVFWQFVYTIYLQQVKQALAVLPTTIQDNICQLFTSTFENRRGHEAA